MPKRDTSVESVSEISVAPRPTGLRAVYLVETGSERESKEIAGMFAELQTRLQIRQLSKGKLLSFAVQADESDAVMLDDIEEILKNTCAFTVTQRSFDELICRVVDALCNDTGSKLIQIPKCDICGRLEPFPSTTVSLSDEDGAVVLERNYCERCTADASATSKKEFVKSLLAADKRNFKMFENAELVRRPSAREPIKFKIKSA